MQNNKRICIAFLGNPLNDSRITNLTNSLRSDGFWVENIGFDWFTGARKIIEKDLSIFTLKRTNSNITFYIKFALLLIKNVYFTKAHIYFAEDLYTLPFVTLIAKLKGAKVVYNSREIYSHIGGLAKRPILQKIVTAIESVFIKRVDLVLTTGEMDSTFIEKLYSINNTLVVRNIPLYQTPNKLVDFRKMFNIANDKLIMLYQGVIINGRGIPLVFEAMQNLPKAVLVLLGDGEQKEKYRLLAKQLKIDDRVIFAGSFRQEELINYTAAADVGLSLIENISISYYHALPNKLFEYIMSGLPILSSNLPQMKKIVDDYRVGECVELKNANDIIEVISRWQNNFELLNNYKENCKKAALELNWQKEYEVLKIRVTDLF